MKPNTLRCSLISGTSLALIASPAFAVTMFVDFGRTDNQTAGNFNNVHGDGTTLATASVALIDSAGNATGITLTTDFSLGGSFAGTGADYAGPYPPLLTGQPSTALIDSLFIRDPASTSFTLSGLAPGTTYDIAIYGARGNNGGANAEWTLTDGSGPNSAAYDVFDNATEVATFTGMVPDGSNEISILYTTTDDGSRPRGGLNFMQITSNAGIPEPSSLGLVSLAGLGLLRRKRS
ncbi:PEP-CTERM sorting domain-containing protein [Verrucomicrobiaceae bacterium 227]